MLPIAPLIIILIRLFTSGRSGSGGGPKAFSATARGGLWVMATIGWAGLALIAVGGVLAFFGEPSLRLAFVVLALIAATVLGACALFFAWPVLRKLARRGRPKLVYYLAHLSLIFPFTGETYAGATLLAAIAFAHRGDMTAKDCDWLASRLTREHRHLGTFGAAFALIEALKARVARDDSRGEAGEHAQRARTLFGTLVYMSPRAVPSGVLRFAYEYLALDDARLGRWGAILLAPEKQATTVVRALAGWVRERGGEAPHPYEARARKKLASPALERLFERPTESTAPRDAAEARARIVRDYVTVVRGHALTPRSALNLLMMLDALLHPEHPETLVPEEVRADAALVDAVHDDVAATLCDAFATTGVPVFALQNVGPISARVHQRLETTLFDELSRALERIAEHRKLGLRRDAFSEWLDVSYVRALYRRIEFTLGPSAAGHVWPQLVHSYCSLGVLLSETFPRRRPLAFAVFRLLSLEAHRFNDATNAKQQLHNMTVTSGVH